MKDTVSLSYPKGQTLGRGNTGTYGSYPKRLFDLFLLAVTAPFAVPLLAVLWVLVRLDGGAGFYRQLRVGQDGKTFALLKLRTMVTDNKRILSKHLAKNPKAAAEWRVKQKLSRDPRVTFFGQFLRKTGLDELPQLLNVLHGEMSIVGPRPFMVEQEQEYWLAGGQAYYQLKPGITGLWQVSARNQSSFRDRVEFDNEYFKSLSFSEDLRIMARTVPAVLRGTGC